MFEALGFNSLTESVYFALLELPGVGVTDLAQRLGTDECAVRAALDDLAEMHLLSERETLLPLNPQIGLSVLLARQEAEVARRKQELEESRVAFATLLARHAEQHPAGPDSGVEHIEGIEGIRSRLSEMALTCEWEAASFMPGGAQSIASMRASRELDAQAIERGVRLRTIYLDSVRNDPATLEYAQWLCELGSEVRTVPTLPMRMIIVDRRIAVVPVDVDNSGDLAVEITNPGVLTGLLALFAFVWKNATPLGTRRRRDDEGLSSQEKQVVRLLGHGLTDETIARRLGVSVRTARRVASTLLARLEAQSRFQAGARAVARGWIDPDDLH